VKFRSAFFAPLLFAVILILVGLVPTLMNLVGTFSEDPFLATIMIRLLVFLLPLAFYCRVRGVGFLESLRFRGFSFRKLPVLSVVFFLFLAGIVLFRYFGLFFLNEVFVNTPSILEFSAESESGFLTFLCAVILPAFLEEFVFRGVLLEEYRFYGSFWAVFLPALMYAMAHLSLQNFLYYFFVGLFLGFVSVFSDSVAPSLFMNVLLKASGMFFRPALVEYLRQAGKTPLLPYLLVAIIIFLVYLLFSRLEYLYREKSYDEVLQSRKELLRRELEDAADRKAQEDAAEVKKRRLDSLKEVLLSPPLIGVCIVFCCLASGFIDFN